MSRSIIIPDIHLRHKHVDTILSWETYDKAIFLGDIFHRYSDTVQENVEAAEWLKERLDDPRNVFLWGNHDWAQRYWPENEWAFCSGCTESKSWAIKQVMKDGDWDKIKPYHVEHGILFSHAGLDPKLFDVLAKAGMDFPCPLDLPTITAWLDLVWPQVVERYKVGSIHPLMEQGVDRGGLQSQGGMNWQDFGRHSPLEEVGQIVGHTHQDINKGPLFRIINKNGAPMWRYASKGVNPRWLKNGWTMCLDCEMHFYAIISDDVLTIKSVNWVRPKGQIDPHVEPGEVVAEIHLKEKEIVT